MANVIRLKRKTTTGLPQLTDLQVGEACFNTVDETLTIKKDTSTLITFEKAGSGGTGDMSKATYDSNDDGKVDTARNAEQLGGNNASDYALKTYVDNAINALVGGAPGALDTLNELAAAMADDAAFATTVTTALASKLTGDSEIDGGTIS